MMDNLVIIFQVGLVDMSSRMVMSMKDNSRRVDHMAEGSILILMGLNMKAIGKTDLGMALESYTLGQIIDTMVNGRRALNMDREHITIRMGTNMKDGLLKTWDKEKEGCIMLTEISTREIGFMIKDMDLDRWTHKTFNTLENGSMIISSNELLSRL